MTVVETAAALFGMNPDDLLVGRQRVVIQYRRAICVAAHEVTGRSSVEIGESLCKDTSTVLHALQTATEQEKFWAKVIGEEALVRWEAREPQGSVR